MCNRPPWKNYSKSTKKVIQYLRDEEISKQLQIFIQKIGNQSRCRHRKDDLLMWVSHLSHLENFPLCLSPFGSVHLPNLKGNPCFNIYCAKETFSFLEWSNTIHISTTKTFHGCNCSCSNSIPQKIETAKTTHLRNSKLYLLFYSIYEISGWSNRIETECKRTHENIKAEQKNSQKSRKYVFPL